MDCIQHLVMCNIGVAGKHMLGYLLTSRSKEELACNCKQLPSDNSLGAPPAPFNDSGIFMAGRCLQNTQQARQSNCQTEFCLIVSWIYHPWTDKATVKPPHQHLCDRLWNSTGLNSQPSLYMLHITQHTSLSTHHTPTINYHTSHIIPICKPEGQGSTT